jgi:hypothetical protein
MSLNIIVFTVHTTGQGDESAFSSAYDSMEERTLFMGGSICSDSGLMAARGLKYAPARKLLLYAEGLVIRLLDAAGCAQS